VGNRKCKYGARGGGGQQGRNLLSHLEFGMCA